MRRIFNLLIFGILAVFLISLVSAEIVISQQPKELYNMGEVVEIPVKIVTAIDINNFFSTHLICNGIETEVQKQYIYPRAGEQEEINSAIPLITSLVGRTSGTCKIKFILGEEYALTNEFEISDMINIRILSDAREFDPGKDIIIEGEALKKNGQAVNGVVQLDIIEANSTLIGMLSNVKNGYFFLNFSMLPTTKAGKYLANINVYEKDFESQIINNGLTSLSIDIKQVPTTLEIVFESQEINPGTNLKVKTILHDQTGEKISSSAVITIKNEQDEILEEAEKQTDEFLEFSTLSNQAPVEWKVVAVSGDLTSESKFKIKIKEEIKIDVINSSLVVTNTGNVPYNKTIIIKIGNETRKMNVSLGVEELKKYVMTAPKGEYEVEIITPEGDRFTGMTVLAGSSVNVKEYSKVDTFIRHPSVWIFMIILLGFVAFIFFRKVYKRNFFAYIPKIPKPFRKKPKQEVSEIQIPFVERRGGEKAELSLSIKGEKQNASIVCLKIKNFEKLKKQGIKDTLEKIKEIAKEKKAVIYESQDTLSFILAPIKTKTFDNEKTALDIAWEIKNTLISHNKLYKEKMDFGIGINYGSIIAKQEETFKFMTLGTFMSFAKKMSSLSGEEIFLSEEINRKILSSVKTEKKNISGTIVYTIKGMKDNEEYKKFISGFLKRIDSEQTKF